MSDMETAAEYLVLARKYRPAAFSGLIGQDAMVRTLTNAIEAGRLAHAFVLTGVRGVGKTTAARIMARCMNCTGPDDNPDYGPVIEPCGVCAACVSIAEDRNVDVIEMDAASRTGVDDVREIIDAVRYKPASARYKIYIIDEVHMLTKNAFNALLKTLEEPPPHVKFIFATTELRKIPVTVLSRCQRFDLRRVEAGVLSAHFAEIAKTENIEIEPEALALTAAAADGSVRDGLSLLDQAIAMANGPVTGNLVRAMLGLADRGAALDIFEALMKGEAPKALELAAAQHGAGVGPAEMTEDLLAAAHWVTRIKISPAAAEHIAVSEADRARGAAMAETLPMAALSRAWQILLNGLDEVRRAPRGAQSLEMLLIRLAYASSLPTPAEAVRALGSNPPPPAAPAPAPAPEAKTAPEAAPDAPPAAEKPAPESFAALAAGVFAAKELSLHAFLSNEVSLVSYEPGRLEIFAPEPVNREGLQKLREYMSGVAGGPWTVDVSAAPGEAPLNEQKKTKREEAEEAAKNDPAVKAVMDAFPDAKIESVRSADETL